jgi:hypothetical protein
MVNNSTNINNTNNHLSPKESLNSDGQQFYQYQTVNIFPIALFSMYCRWKFTFQEERIDNSLNGWSIVCLS